MHSSEYVYTDQVPDHDNPHPLTPELFYFHHNGDFSGDVIINLEAWRTVQTVEPCDFGSRNDQGICEVKIPFEVLAQLVSEAVLSKRVSDLEQANYRKILGL